MPKVVLKASSAEEEVVALAEQAEKAGLPVAAIKDAGKTVVSAGTITCVGIGPAEEQEIDPFAGNMELVR
jgi:peptidyl-tRNA hydrolase